MTILKEQEKILPQAQITTKMYTAALTPSWTASDPGLLSAQNKSMSILAYNLLLK